MQVYKEEDFFSGPEGLEAVLLWRDRSASLALFKAEKANKGPGAVYEWSAADRDRMEIIDLLNKLNPDSIRIVTAGSGFSLMPLEMAKDSESTEWHQHLPGDSQKGVLVSDKKSIPAVSVSFEIDPGDFEFLASLRNDQKVEHLAGVLLENMEKVDFVSLWSKIVLYFVDNQMFAVAVKHGKPVLVNAYSYQVPADALYYLLWIKKELFADESEVPIFANGLIKTGSNLHNTLKNYIDPLHFGTSLRKKSDDLNKDFPAHTFSLLREIS